jgi:hypothetical protein
MAAAYPMRLAPFAFVRLESRLQIVYRARLLNKSRDVEARRFRLPVANYLYAYSHSLLSRSEPHGNAWRPVTFNGDVADIIPIMPTVLEQTKDHNFAPGGVRRSVNSRTRSAISIYAEQLTSEEVAEGWSESLPRA